MALVRASSIQSLSFDDNENQANSSSNVSPTTDTNTSTSIKTSTTTDDKTEIVATPELISADNVLVISFFYKGDYYIHLSDLDKTTLNYAYDNIEELTSSKISKRIELTNSPIRTRLYLKSELKENMSFRVVGYDLSPYTKLTNIINSFRKLGRLYTNNTAVFFDLININPQRLNISVPIRTNNSYGKVYLFEYHYEKKQYLTGQEFNDLISDICYTHSDMADTLTKLLSELKQIVNTELKEFTENEENLFAEILPMTNLSLLKYTAVFSDLERKAIGSILATNAENYTDYDIYQMCYVSRIFSKDDFSTPKILFSKSIEDYSLNTYLKSLNIIEESESLENLISKIELNKNKSEIELLKNKYKFIKCLIDAHQNNVTSEIDKNIDYYTQKYKECMDKNLELFKILLYIYINYNKSYTVLDRIYGCLKDLEFDGITNIISGRNKISTKSYNPRKPRKE